MSDNLSTPTILGGTTGSLPFNLATATATAGMGSEKDLWYQFTATGKGVMVIRLGGLTGGAIGALSVRAFQPFTTDVSQLRQAVGQKFTTAGGIMVVGDVLVDTALTYAFRVYSSAGIQGTLTWNYHESPPSVPGPAPVFGYDVILARRYRPNFEGGDN